MSYVNMKNCIKFYQTAEEMNAELLKNHCSELISNHWVRLLILNFVFKAPRKQTVVQCLAHSFVEK